MRSCHLQTSRLDTHYLEAGDGEPLLLIHGWPQTSRCWHKVMPALARQFRVIAPDLRGFGQSGKDGLPLSRAQLAADMLALLDALDIRQAHVAGHDWGGMVAFKLALDYPDRLRTLCLIDCSTTHWPHWALHGLWAKVPDWAEGFFARGHDAFVRWCFRGTAPDYPAGVVSPFPLQPLPGMDWCDENSLQCYLANLADPATQAASISLYRDALPFNRQDESGHWQVMTSKECHAIWQHPGGACRHPAYRQAVCFAPEDLGETVDIPALYLYTPMLLPGGFRDGLPIPAYQPDGNPYADSIAAPFSRLTCLGITSGHFIPEEQPAAVISALSGFLDSNR